MAEAQYAFKMSKWIKSKKGQQGCKFKLPDMFIKQAGMTMKAFKKAVKEIFGVDING